MTSTDRQGRPLFDDVHAAGIVAPHAVRALPPSVRVTEAYDAWWSFACERQHIYYRRLRGAPSPWTADTTLSRYRFTNAYRAADRVSQYLIREVIYSDGFPREPNEVVFRILLFKLFNRIETWETLTSQLGPLALADDPFERIDQTLSRELAAGRRIYSGAYIMPTRPGRGGGERKHRAHLALLRTMMSDCLGDRLADAPNMKAGFDLFRSYPMIGDFLAYQFITDINYSDLVDFSETEFVAAGPGAREGLRKCFADTGGWSDCDLIRMMMEIQHEEFERLGLDFANLFGRPLKLIDCQNLFCEVAKYARARFPALTPLGGRVRIKQKYRPAGRIAMPFFPPKWGINDTVEKQFPALTDSESPDLARYQAQAAGTSFHAPVRGGDAITTPMLGLIGETGEVVSELKKRAREGSAYIGFRDRLSEELGDLLWYLADLAERRGIRLAKADRAGANGCADDAMARKDDGWIRAALSLAEQSGRMASLYTGLLDGRKRGQEFDAELSKSLSALMAEIRTLASLNGLTLGRIAEENLAKINRRWLLPKDGQESFDRLWPESERLPTCFDAVLADRGGRVSISFCIGDKTIPTAADILTDNAYDPDGYRFHDVFHLAYAAVLDWSPVTRRLLCRKRKSDPRVDEVEDGGRAAVIEEGIAALVFAYAAKHRMLKGVRTVEDSLLRTIRDMTGHLEVSARSSAEWQDAIIQGFGVWRSIRDAGGGRVRVDRLRRQITGLGNGAQIPPDNAELPLC